MIDHQEILWYTEKFRVDIMLSLNLALEKGDSLRQMQLPHQLPFMLPSNKIMTMTIITAVVIIVWLLCIFFHFNAIFCILQRTESQKR